MWKAIVDALLQLFRPMPKGQVDAILTRRAAQVKQRLDWPVSIVDLLKLLDMDSSLEGRRKLADSLGWNGTAKDGSAEKNMWLHKRVLEEVAAGRIRVP